MSNVELNYAESVRKLEPRVASTLGLGAAQRIVTPKVFAEVRTTADSRTLSELDVIEKAEVPGLKQPWATICERLQRNEVEF